MSNTPTKIVTPFGLDSTNIDAYPSDSPDITGLSAPEGFPANYMTTGGDKPRGQLFNRLLFDVTYWVREFLSGRTPRYDAAYQTLLGGYDADSTVMGDDGLTIYLSTVNNNMTNPNSGGAGWVAISGGGDGWDFTLGWGVGVPTMVNLGRLNQTVAEFLAAHPKVALCDGNNGTLDFTNRIPIGADATEAVTYDPTTSITGSPTKTGGSKDAVIVNHTHPEQIWHENSPTGGYYAFGGGPENWSLIDITEPAGGVSGTDQNLPPYIAVAFFERVEW